MKAKYLLSFFLILATIMISGNAGAQTPVTLSAIDISGPAQVDSGATATFSATATYSDGSTKTVTPTWSLGSTTFASIDIGGILSAKTVTSDQVVTVKADYTEGGITKSATKSVKIVALSTSHLIYKDDFSECTAAGCPNWETITGAWIVKNEMLVSTKEEKSIILVQNVPGLEQFSSGRLQAKVGLTKKCKIWKRHNGQWKSAKPNAAIVFAYVDKDHYRYVSLQNEYVLVGQVGDYDGQTAGLKAFGRLPVPGFHAHMLRVDIQSNGDVVAYVDAANPHRCRRSAITGFSFGSAAAGRVGFAANKARSSFDDFFAWDSGVLPVNPVLPSYFEAIHNVN